MDTITPLISASSLTSSTDQHGGSRQSFTQRMIGEVLHANVLEARSSNQFLLDFSGSTIPVTSNRSLTVGQTLLLQISQLTPNVELRIVSEPASLLAGKQLALLGKSLNISSLFHLLQQGNPPAFSTLTDQTTAALGSYLPADLLSVLNSPQGGTLLQQLILNLGLNLEASLARGEIESARNTLKSSLLEILTRFPTVDKITEQANSLHSTLELFQLSQLQLNSQNIFILPLPLPFLEQGYLLLEDTDHEAEHKGEHGQQHKLSLHLTVSGLGDIRIDILHEPENLFVKLFFDSEEIAQFVSQFSKDLQALLSTDSKTIFSFSAGAGSPSLHLARKLMPDGESIINTTA
jgi:hypothetical protein